MIHLSSTLQEMIGKALWEKNTVGMSGAGVYKLTGIKSGGNAYLKTAHLGNPETLHEEMLKLNWLEDKAFVPKVIYYETNGELEYLLITEITGENLKEASLGIRNSIEMGKKLAEGLRIIHQIPIIECPFNETLPVKLKKSKERMDLALVDPKDFDPEYSGKTAEQLLDVLETTKPKKEDLVFTHGDFSLANVMVQSNQISGFVDWGRAGISDRHQDIGIAIRSLKHNFSQEAVEAFIETYGKQLIDLDKVNYYILLDELF